MYSNSEQNSRTSNSNSNSNYKNVMFVSDEMYTKCSKLLYTIDIATKKNCSILYLSNIHFSLARSLVCSLVFSTSSPHRTLYRLSKWVYHFILISYISLFHAHVLIFIYRFQRLTSIYLKSISIVWPSFIYGDINNPSTTENRYLEFYYILQSTNHAVHKTYL